VTHTYWLAGALVIIGLQPCQAAADDRYWLIREFTGRWEYRVGTERPRPLSGQYETLVPEGQVRCLEPDVRTCELRFLVNPRSNITERLPVRVLQTGQWISLRRLKPPPAPVLPATASELAAKFARETRVGGSRSGSGCGGDLVLKAPACGESVDVEHFTIRWTPLASGRTAVLVERADGEAALFRGQSSAAAGQFADAALTAFLRRIQSQTDTVDIIVRVMAEGGQQAVRLARVPPAGRMEDYTSRVGGTGVDASLASVVTRMTLALEEEMWSRAAEHATAIIPLAGGSASLLEYSLVGLCQSDFQAEKALLRTHIGAARYTEICPSATAAAPVAAARPLDPDAPTTPAAAKTRVGIALLIGNYEYWNTPLNSVKSDLQGMSDTLRSLGFVVNARENLRNPRQFGDALEDVLKKEGATPDDVLLVYYSGHGIQLDGKAHLLSTGISGNARVAEDFRENAESAEDLLARMERSIPGRRVLIVEACRNDLLSASAASGAGAKGGFAFQQDDVPNTFVMFANRPGATTPVRSDFGLMGPFTEALVYALQNSNGEILDVFATAARKTAEMSPDQEPVLYHSKAIDQVVLKPQTPGARDARARELLNAAETSYAARAWDAFLETMIRARAVAADPSLQQRLSQEAEFAGLVVRAEVAEQARKWADSAAHWEKAYALFAVREWVGMNAGVAWLLADETARGVQILAALGAQSDTDLAGRAQGMVKALVAALPPLKDVADAASRGARKISRGPEFEKVPDKE